MPASAPLPRNHPAEWKDLLWDTAKIVVDTIRTIQIHRALTQAWPSPHLDFWRMIIGNMFDAGAIHWCKLFGSPGDDDAGNPTHWKNIVADEDQFRNDLLRYLNITRRDWDAYGKKLRDFRNWDAAHYDERRRDLKTYPNFDIALKATYFYYDYLTMELARYGIDTRPLDLRDFSERFIDQARLIANAACGATKHMEEKVTISG
ncbi:MAG: hypothetical protein WBX25_21435 [Rhodomicrobium sp.]